MRHRSTGPTWKQLLAIAKVQIAFERDLRRIYLDSFVSPPQDVLEILDPGSVSKGPCEASQDQQELKQEIR